METIICVILGIILGCINIHFKNKKIRRDIMEKTNKNYEEENYV